LIGWTSCQLLKLKRRIDWRRLIELDLIGLLTCPAMAAVLRRRALMQLNVVTSFQEQECSRKPS
jgi:hypothetical protein